MKRIVRILTFLVVSLLALWPLVVLADTISDITQMVADPSNTSIILTWVKPTSSNATPNTVIRYRTDTYPTSTTDGILAYNGTASQVTVGSNTTGEHPAGDNVTALTAGQVYYFSAWGFTNGTYSTNAYRLVMSTLSVVIASGGQQAPKNSIPSPTIGAEMNQAPSNSGFNLEPFSSIIKYFNSAPGGLGMPENNAWEVFAILGIVGGGFATYIRIRNFFVAFGVVFILTFFGIGLHLVQGWLLGVELVMGLGVWAIEHYLQ